METTMNPGGIIARNEFEETITKPRTVATVPEHQHEELVHRSEFRLLLWIGAFVVITISGGFTFLYTGQRDLQAGLADLRVEIANLRVEMKQELADIRVAMEQEHANIRVEMKQELADIRVEMKQELANIRVTMEQEHADIRSGIAGLSERVARVETVLSK